MPEIRYIEEYTYPEDLPPDQRTPDRAKINRTTFEVSDEELAEENRVQRMANILDEMDELKSVINTLRDRLGRLERIRR